ncbi:MAG: hypothetical protein HC845_04030 [Akkermansiaceae bacterium]|nr:hypothetical protein [Akkermansiaceae bacterium]
MKSLSTNLALTTGFLLLSAPRLLATDSEIKMNLTSYVQKERSVSSTTERGKVDKVRLSSKDMLKLLSKEAEVDVSGGSKLIFDETGKVFIVDPSKNRRIDVTRYMSAELDLSTQLFGGAKNLETQKEESRRYFPVTFTMTLSGLNASVQGLVIEKFKKTAADEDGIQRVKASSETAFNGQGAINRKTAYFDGNITIMSRSATINK